MLLNQNFHYFPETQLSRMHTRFTFVLSKGKSGMPSLCNGPEVLSSVSDKAKLFPKKFSKNSNPDDSRCSQAFSLSRTNLKLHNSSVTPKIVKTITINLDSSKASSPDCIPMVVLKTVTLNSHTYQLNSSRCV